MKAVLPSAAAAVCLLSTGCLSLSRHNGAKVLEKGQVEVGLGLGARTPDDPVLFPLPVPQGPVLVRVGLGRDVDLGFEGYLLGSGFDLRYRFHQQGRWHAAVNPGVGFVILPSLFDPAQIGAVEASMPVMAEVDALDWMSLSFGTGLTLRENISLGPDSTVARFDLYVNLGGRVEARTGLFAFGFAVDGLFAPTRYTNLPGATVALDARIRTRTKEEARERQERLEKKKRDKDARHARPRDLQIAIDAVRRPDPAPEPEAALVLPTPSDPGSSAARWVPARVRWARWVSTDDEARLDGAFGFESRVGWAW